MPTPALVNLALNQPTWQVCTLHNYDSSLAVDGNRDGNLENMSVTHTCEKLDNPWWRVDLGSLHRIVNVVIYNRRDCCPTRTRNFYVHIMNENTDIVASKYYDGVVSDKVAVNLDHAEGRFVQIQLTGNDILNLAEVEVYGYPAHELHDQCHA
jgi:hypothetical protein